MGDVLQNNQLRKIEKKEETLLKLSELEQRLEQAAALEHRNESHMRAQPLQDCKAL